MAGSPLSASQAGRKPRHSLRTRLRRIPQFLLWSYRKAGQDELFPQAGALSFLTLFSLVPLLATFSFFGAKFLNQPELVKSLAALLPYQEASVAEVLAQFVEASGSLSGIGFGTLLITVFSGFASVEGVINRIWDVPKRRSWYSRITSFILVLLGGPLLIAAGYWAVYYIENEPRWSALAALGLVQILPFLITVVALALVYWQVPNTFVRFESALVGAVTAGLLLEVLRLGFGFYVESATDISVVYGSFGIAIFFLFSIQAAWTIVLLGCEIAYCVQNFEVLSRPKQHSALDGCRLGLLAMILSVERFRAGTPRVTHEFFAGRLGLTSGEVRRVLEPLAKKGYLIEDSDDDGGWLLAKDPHEVSVGDIFGCYDQTYDDIHEALPAETAASLDVLFDRLDEQTKRQVGQLMVVDLLPVCRPAAPAPLTAEEQEAATARTVGAVIIAEREAAADLAAAERDKAADLPAIQPPAAGGEPAAAAPHEERAASEAAPSLPPEMLPAEEAGTHPPGAPAKGDAGR